MTGRWSRKRILRILVATVAALGVVLAGLVLLFLHAIQRDPFAAVFEENCSVCHGKELEGTPLGIPLVGVDLTHGDSISQISTSIAEGFPQRGMPAWSEALDPARIRSLAIYVAERRLDRRFNDFKVDTPLTIPQGTVESELHDFRLEVVATGLDPLPYSIAPLPDGRILLTEKKRGLSIISAEGEQSELIEGTPETLSRHIEINSLEFGVGWMMDVAIHPEYAQNGWIYLHSGHLCSECGEGIRNAIIPRTMNRLVRGHIENGAWVDEEVIWSADPETYTSTPDMAAGGRTAFDDEGHVFLSVGIKGTSNYMGIQDLGLPYGKIHRVHDDGRIPPDNPFVGVPGALETIWSYGHRSPQGLEWNRQTRQLWGTEMGPRGGDEVNLLLPGRNYGWPLTSRGLDYDGTPVEYGKQLGIELDLASIEQPVVDLTPSPAISSFIFYDGNAFPEWRNHIIVGSLKATELYRIVVDGDQWVRTETLLRNLARIRDVESGPDGEIYLLLEHASGGQIVKLVPARARTRS